MGIIDRTVRIVRGRLNSLISRFEDPIRNADLKEEEMKEQLEDINNSLIELKTEKKRVEGDIEDARQKIKKRVRQAKSAKKQNKLELAREALRKKQTEEKKLRESKRQFREIKRDEEQLKKQREKFKKDLRKFERKKEMKKSNYKAAKARERVSDILRQTSTETTGTDQILDDMDDIINDKKARAQARTEFVEEEEDDIDSKLEDVEMDASIEEELRRLDEETTDKKTVLDEENDRMSLEDLEVEAEQSSMKDDKDIQMEKE